MHPRSKVQTSDLIFSEFHDAVFSKLIDSIAPLVGFLEGEEVAQEALFRVYLSLEKHTSDMHFREQLFQRKAFVFVIAKNMALSRLRHKKVRERFYDVQRNKCDHSNIKSVESE